ncbi:hypothetical protein C8A01DRAFT_38850 [Parachaetomium inaequale]|uniref:Uncharacterized protein n=1 Tax=Parachaetomium inaequale TaxID=2588326 RepID=A0AAN6SNA6_9PEZI|nr:hypothetical protein C8A01DRAFT_38850 [Parachaetomium inaequale]
MATARIFDWDAIEPLVIDLNKPIVRLNDEFYSVILDLVEEKSADYTTDEMLQEARSSVEAARAEAVPAVIASLRNGMRGPSMGSVNADDYTLVEADTGADSTDEYSEVEIEGDDTDAWSKIFFFTILIAATNTYVRFVHFHFGADYEAYLDARSVATQEALINDDSRDALVYMQCTNWFNLQSFNGKAKTMFPKCVKDSAIIDFDDFVGRFADMDTTIWATFEPQCDAIAKEAVREAIKKHDIKDIITDAKGNATRVKQAMWYKLFVRRVVYEDTDLFQVMFYDRVARAGEEYARRKAAEEVANDAQANDDEGDFVIVSKENREGCAKNSLSTTLEEGSAREHGREEG